MKDLLEKARSFSQRISGEREKYRKLAAGQSPEALFIACSDSRVMPALITVARPGQLFELRNAGNIVPPYGHQAVSGEVATIEYAVNVLKVRDIVVCGHSHCGALGALARKEDLSALPAVGRWLELAKSPLAHALSRPPEDPTLLDLGQRHVVAQLAALRTYPAIKARLDAGEMTLHGWFYKVDTGEVREFDGREEFRVHGAF
ncbi:carbonic anhydrase [Sinosporangium siamense]|uniref:Carbonic anhydrase n=1 Tax=Sinosporangium siamense TaxID=1367973 RepID=A0A919RKH6_9ACTN|nr:carbonic anhydrase [Sinosporangium siamense]GII95497.1 carbonic anhydrase [Sinosporangium siamense]